MNSSRIEITHADITTLSVDAIVNAANEGMLGGGGVDGAIHRAAGPGLLEECKAASQIRPGIRCPTGESRITGGYNLPATHVIHTVGPIWRDGQHKEPQLLASCYRSSLELAVKHHIRSIAFPAISCGVYGYPLEDAATVAISETKAFLDTDSTIEKVLFVAFDPTVHKALKFACENIGD